ncbi:LOW QUALITY PROTEIN: uncharacterized protein LOC108597901, partial [Drosophila busckii]|uniref:LOW QUALITY PROTEIN: uncharacterized protein LOC108597901 n=1 Tax=Drosophila busckii TaxID=30019 RepID=UPI001432C984
FNTSLAATNIFEKFSNMELTLEQLARIALGVPEMSHVNVAVLHSLLNALLQKLDCAQQVVTIGGFEGQCLQRILERAKISPLPFGVERIEPISNELSKIAALEQRCASLERKLECHFQHIRKSNKIKNKQYNTSELDKYASPCEDLCTVCDEHNKIACDLLNNADFLQKLLRCIASPILDKMDEMTRKLERFYETLKDFLRQTEALFQRLELVKQCVIEIEGLRHLVQEYNLTFIGTMEELQDMLDSKLDKVHMPALKKYIRDRFDDIEQRLLLIEEKESCPRAAGFINEGIRCISCGNTRVGVDVGAQSMSLMPDAPAKLLANQPPLNLNAPPNCQKTVICRSLEKEPTLMLRVHNLDLTVLEQRLTRTNVGKVCKLPEANDTIYGIRNSIYSG